MNSNKLILVSLLCGLSFGAQAKSPESIGKHFAEATMCKAIGELNKPEHDIVKLKMTAKFKVLSRSDRWKSKFNKGKFKAFDEQKKQPKWAKRITCNNLRKTYL